MTFVPGFERATQKAPRKAPSCWTNAQDGQSRLVVNKSVFLKPLAVVGKIRAFERDVWQLCISQPLLGSDYGANTLRACSCATWLHYELLMETTVVALTYSKSGFEKSRHSDAMTRT